MSEIGLVIGKFYPPHQGHQHLIETGLKYCDQLYLILCERTGESPPGRLRLKWIQEMYPQVKSSLLHDVYDPDDSVLWAKLTIEHLGFAPNVVFTSESYGPKYCQYLKCNHLMVDQPRETVPISGTLIRSNPFKYWKFLGPPLREWYAFRVVVLGPESTGKTTLCQKLADKYRTVWVPEYGRDFTLEKYTEDPKYVWKSEDFDVIAEKQNQMENKKARESNGLVICDTNSLATYVWHDRYMKSERPQVMKIYHQHYQPVLYLLTTTEVAFVQDGIRDGEHIRNNMFHQFHEVLTDLGEKFKVIKGDSYEDRFDSACREIDAILK